MNKRPLYYFAKVGNKMIAKLEMMVEEDREFTSELFEPIDEMLREPNKKQRDDWIRTLTKKSHAGKKV